MKATINVDIGGTFTDAFVTWDGRSCTVKTPTTGYDLSVGFMRALQQAADVIGIPIEELIGQTGIVRYSTTIAMNTLIQRTGPKLGLMVTQGFEDTIYVGKGAQWRDGLTYREARNVARAVKPQPLIPREMVVGLRERIDSTGSVLWPLDEEDVREKLRCLVDKGARGFVVSCLWSFLNPSHENRVAEIIREEYPEAFLGSMPVILSSQVLPKRNEYPRTMAAILNAYLHQSMASELRGMSDELRTLGYQRPMMMVHNTGGMAEVFRTTALQTYNGGPVAGLIGSAHLSKLFGYENVVATDMGGTSFDLGIVTASGRRAYAFQPIIDRWMVDMTMLETRSIGAGGGSIAWLNPLVGNRLEVGPQSAGSMPGPACYDQGGEEPTVTDADVVLGYISPGNYHGGRIPLNKDRALEAIEKKVARPLGLDVVPAALLIKKVIDGKMGNTIFTETVLRGFDPSRFTLFAFGGAGPTHCCGYSAHARIPRTVVFPFSPAFCAFGSANMDVVHTFEQSRRLKFMEPLTRAFVIDSGQFNRQVEELRAKALRELALEGVPVEGCHAELVSASLDSKELSLERVAFELELDMKYGGQLHQLRVRSPGLFIENENDCRAIYQAFEQEYRQVFSSYSVYPEGGVDIETFALRATASYGKHELPMYDYGGETPPAGALKESRPAYWPEFGEFKVTPVFEQSLLRHGNIIAGPAIVEAADTTTVIPPGFKMRMNRYLAGEIERL